MGTDERRLMDLNHPDDFSSLAEVTSFAPQNCVGKDLVEKVSLCVVEYRSNLSRTSLTNDVKYNK